MAARNYTGEKDNGPRSSEPVPTSADVIGPYRTGTPHVEATNQRTTQRIDRGTDRGTDQEIRLPAIEANRHDALPTERTQSEALLLDRAAAGDSDAFHEVVDRHLDRLYRLAVSMLGNSFDAEDVLQESLAGAFRGIAKFERRSSVGTWLTRIVVTQVARWRRDKYRRRDNTPIEQIEASSENAGSTLSAADAAAVGVDAKIDVQAALQRLSPAHREVIVLREFEHMSYDEIADAIGVPQGTVESRLHRARCELKQILQAYLP